MYKSKTLGRTVVLKITNNKQPNRDCKNEHANKPLEKENL